MAHPKPAGDPDALSSQLRARTMPIHKEAENRPFMLAFFRGQLTRDAYVDWIARQRHVYAAIEDHLRDLPPHDPAAAVVPPALYRADRLEADLDALTDGHWRDANHLTEATRAYVELVHEAADFPPALIAHAWLRYLGNVGGRDVLRRLVGDILDAGPGDGGMAFVDYDQIGEVGPFFRGFHARLDALELDDAGRDRVIATAEAGFRANIALTDELAADHGIEAPAA